MPRKKHKPEEIIQHLRTVELKEKKGESLESIARSIEVSAHTIIRWQKEYGGLKVPQAKRLKELEKENARLKKIVADQVLDMAILKDVAEGNF